MGNILGRDVLVAARVLKTTTLDVPELGGEIRLRQLSAADSARWEEARRGAPDDIRRDMRLFALLLSLTWVDENGEPVLTDSDADQELLLGALSLSLLGRIFNDAAAASGMTPTAAEDAKKN